MEAILWPQLKTTGILRWAPNFTLSRNPASTAVYKEKEEASSETSSCGDFVRWARLELAQDYSHYPLKVACLPFHHHRFWIGTAKIRINFNSPNFSARIFKKIVYCFWNWCEEEQKGILFVWRYRDEKKIANVLEIKDLFVSLCAFPRVGKHRPPY